MLHSEQKTLEYYTYSHPPHMNSTVNITDNLPTSSHSFFKTKMCPYFLRGKCIKGGNCTFAHSNSELKELPDLHKTKYCKAFASGTCKKINCAFAHGEAELKSVHHLSKPPFCSYNKESN